MWTDEKADAEGRTILYRERGTRYHPQHVQRTQHSGRVAAQFWGYITAAGPGELVTVPNHMNSDDYIDVLQNVLLPSLQANFPEQNEFLFMHDNSSVHTSHKTQRWLQEHPEIVCIEWPPRSPDCNPMEHVWAYMINKWEQRRQDKKKQILVNHVMELWSHLKAHPSIASNLVKSVPARLQEIITNSGDYTKY